VDDLTIGPRAACSSRRSVPSRLLAGPVAVLCATSLLVAGTSAGAANGGSTRHAVTVVGTSFRNGSCSSRYYCTVLATLDVRGSEDVVWREHASKWTILQVLHARSLSAVSCPTATWCMAVGTQPGPHVDTQPTDTTFAEAVTDSLVVVKLPVPRQSSELTAISCVSASSCVAVGDDQQRQFGESETLAERWNGTSWSLMSPAGGFSDDLLTSVSCSGTDQCVAIGYNVSGGRPVAEVWDGGAWSLRVAPRVAWKRPKCPPGALGCFSPPPAFEMVSCGGPAYCMALGGVLNDTQFVDLWNGTRWVKIIPPQLLFEHGVFVRLSSLSCVRHRCLTVGQLILANAIQPFAMEWTGSRWVDVSARSFSKYQHGSLNAVGCTSVSYCIAIGSAESGDAMHTPFGFLAVLSAGHWTLGPSVVKE
jgi:hypothetical protein